MNILVGHTGFVGSNLYTTGEFTAGYNSKNIEEAFGTNPDLLVYAGLNAEKYLANSAPQKDRERILQAEVNIEKINPKKLVLISTIDVFNTPKAVNENSVIDKKGLQAYGYHRYQMEEWVRENYSNALIVRLPGLFGRNIKKNFIYDYIHLIPTKLTKRKMEELSKVDPELYFYYMLQEDNFYQVKSLSKLERKVLKEKFRRIGFNALYFTDSRSTYQFYNLDRLWSDIQLALHADIKLLHLATEPINAGRLYKYLTGREFINELEGSPAEYDFHTIYGTLFGRTNEYIDSADNILIQIKKFAEDFEIE